MVRLRDFKSSSGQDVLVIRGNANDPMKVATILTVYRVVSGKYVGPFPKNSYNLSHEGLVLNDQLRGLPILGHHESMDHSLVQESYKVRLFKEKNDDNAPNLLRILAASFHLMKHGPRKTREKTTSSLSLTTLTDLGVNSDFFNILREFKPLWSIVYGIYLEENIEALTSIGNAQEVDKCSSHLMRKVQWNRATLKSHGVFHSSPGNWFSFGHASFALLFFFGHIWHDAITLFRDVFASTNPDSDALVDFGASQKLRDQTTKRQSV
ncbi:hypothetical protein M9H77_03119 [Catharanthus roseus]|uniref:Uncharacterized protein n=1 Tax=Catharanthus roseus TaxID=4058 RepID=A0ACC0CAD7_CATRO|nr:hypothetical protein M9H77_03119 [Catharanthus roseus]